METGQESCRDVERKVAFVLLSLPVKTVGSDGLELVELGPENTEVQIVSKINPGTNEEPEIGAYEGMVEVVEGFRSLKS